MVQGHPKESLSSLVFKKYDNQSEKTLLLMHEKNTFKKGWLIYYFHSIKALRFNAISLL